METTVRPCCPACTKEETIRIGKLPDNNLFAGVFLDRDLAGGWLYRCSDCNLKFRHPIDSADDHGILYDNQETLTWPANIERPDWELIAQYVAEHKPAGRILDFGCYTGGLLNRLGSDIERYGIEINSAAAAEATRVTGLPTYSSIDDIPEHMRFDVVIACDVIEHMVNPALFIRKLGSLLSKKGILILTTGDSENRLWNRFGANWWYCFFPEHVSFISENWLARNRESLGLSLLHCETFKYSCLKPASKPFHIALTYFYGWFPDLYLKLRNMFDARRGRPGTSSVTGVGVSDDHLFAVMAPSDGPKLMD